MREFKIFLNQPYYCAKPVILETDNRHARNFINYFTFLSRGNAPFEYVILFKFIITVVCHFRRRKIIIIMLFILIKPSFQKSRDIFFYYKIYFRKNSSRNLLGKWKIQFHCFGVLFAYYYCIFSCYTDEMKYCSPERNTTRQQRKVIKQQSISEGFGLGKMIVAWD